MPKKRNETGRYVETVTLDDVLSVFDAVPGPAVVTSGDVADETELSHDSARRKLETLKERGCVGSRRSAGRVLYWRTDDATESRERGVTPSDAHTVDTTTESETPATRQSAARDGGPVSALDSGDDERARAREILHSLDGRAGEGKDFTRRVEAVLQMYDHLREHAGKKKRKSDFEELLKDTDVGYGTFGSLWSNWVSASDQAEPPRPENALGALPGVEKRNYSYVYTRGDDA